MRRAITSGERGSALLLVLIMGALLTSLALVTMRHFSASIRATVVYLDEVRVDEYVRSGIDLAMAQVSQLPEDQRKSGSATQGMDRGSIKVEFQSEAGRADVNMAPPELLTALIGTLGVENDLARRLGDEIADWREDGTDKRLFGAKDDDYAAKGRPLPGKRPFVSIYELSQVLDMTPEVLAKLLPLVTVASGVEKIDPTIAGPDMIKALFGGNEEQAAAYLADRARGFASPEAALGAFPGSVKDFLGTDAGEGIRFRVEASVGRLVRRSEGVMRQGGDDPGGFRVLSWQPIGK